MNYLSHRFIASFHLRKSLQSNISTSGRILPKLILIYLLGLSIIIQSYPGFGQTGTRRKVIAGSVTDENNTGLSGVSVAIKGTNTGTFTDKEGNTA